MALQPPKPEQRRGTARFFARYYHLLIVIVPLIVFSASVRNGFVYLDDDILILENQAKITHLAETGKFFSSDAFLNNSSPYYRPILNVSLMLDAQIGKTSAGFYHFMNLLLHLLCCMTLFRLLQLLGAGREKAFAGAMVFAVHPIMASAVFWIPARSDLLVALFGMLFFSAGIRYARGKKPLWLAASILCFAIALFSKESAVLLPLLLLAWMLLTRQKQSNIMVLLTGPAAIIAGWFWLRSISVTMIGAEQLGFASIVKNAPFPFEIIARFFLPFILPVAPTFSTFFTAVGILFAIALPLFWLSRKGTGNNLFLIGALWFIAFSLPNMFVWLRTTPDSYEYLVHRAYMPLAGF
jgi:protein O-mannosyl-transferase